MTVMPMNTDELTSLIAQDSDSSDSNHRFVPPAQILEDTNIMNTETPNIAQDDKQSSNNGWRKDLNSSIFLLTIFSAIGGFLFGYDTGVVSGAMLQIQDDPRINPDTVWTELIVSVTVSECFSAVKLSTIFLNQNNLYLIFDIFRTVHFYSAWLRVVVRLDCRTK